MQLIKDQEQCLAVAENAYKRIPQFMKEMTKEELAVMLNGVYAMAVNIRKDWKYRQMYCQPLTSSECPQLTEIFMAIQDYKELAFIEDCRMQMESALEKHQAGGFVYVIEFDDGHVKIGRSIDPDSRIKSVVGGNQSVMTRHWISERCDRYGDLEKAAHRHFSGHRKGGEFFEIGYEIAVEWIAGEWAKHKIRGAE